MKKLSSILFISFMVNNILFAQNAFNDAFKLKNLGYQVTTTIDFEAEDSLQLAAILGNYLNNKNINYSELVDEFQNNKFISLPSISAMSKGKKTFNIKGLIEETKIGSIGSLNITNLADGTAQFLIERSKQEIAITFFKDFKTKLENTPELSTLFPQTISFIDLFPEYEYAKMLNALRDAFITDLENLPNSIPKLKTSNATAFYSTQNGKLFLASLGLVTPIKNGEDFESIIQIMLDSPELIQFVNGVAGSKSYENIMPSLDLTLFISKSLRSNEEGKYWVSYADILRLLSDDDLFKIYLGLLYQLDESEQITFKTNSSEISFKELLGKMATTTSTFNRFKQSISLINLELRELNEIQNTITSSSKPDMADLLTLTKSSTELIVAFYDLGNTLDGTIVKGVNLTPMLTSVNSALSFVRYIENKQYSAGFFELYNFFNSVGIDLDNMDLILKYGTFIASVAEAESASEVQSAIEAVALPAGSSRIKRQSKFNISLNSYVGIFGGQETLINPPDSLNIDSPDAGTFGLTAPIGISLNWGGKRFLKSCNVDKNNAGVHTIFFSLIDLGTFVSYRVKDTETALPEFELQNIISPGIYYKYGFRNSPFTLGFGAQYGPQLRKIAETSESSVIRDSYRIQASLTVDIPIFTIKNITFD